MAATSTSEAPVNSTEGPVLSFLNKRIRALRKKHTRIIQMEESLSQGKTLNKEQQETLRSKPGVVALIDELEKLRAPLSVAVDEEVALALQSQPSSDLQSAGGSGDTTASDSVAPEEGEVAPPTVSGGHREGDTVEDLLNLLYFGSLFDVMPQSDFTSMMLTRTHERGCCLTYDYVTDDATDLLGERDLDLIADLKGLMISRPLSASLSHKNALQRCIEHAKLWLAKSDQPIAPETNVTYVGLREKLSKILSSDYYTTTPEMRGSVEMAAAAGVASFGSFQVPIHGSVMPVSMPVQAEESTVKYQEEEQNVNHEEYEVAGHHQSVPVEGFQKHNSEAENAAEEVSLEAEQEITQAEVEQQNRDLDSKDQPQYGARRPYQNNRGGGGRGGRRGYPNGRGGRGSGRGGGPYQNGRGGQYYDQGGNYYPRNNNNNNYRGGRGGRGGNSQYNYNQSSGMQGARKTYTMSGITEYTVADIYDYIQKHEERAFVLKFSAMEIYNENVRDLLSSDNTPLRLLDDPERGTIVEKLTEETLKDWNHLKKLLSICEAQRKIGETSLNETSSRSHQILKLTIESSAREFLGKENSSTLSASVFFIDLAGSERASQALSAGTRLKEGCHINRSLLTLGNVIRKLSKGRQGHINYRDSKLTRILQPCLGGNARTSIICTLSPARTHVEQSRNTLLFASCAKEVTTNAQVNVVMSDKALVKHLQKELARLESELRSPAPTSSSCNCAVIIRKKDLQIEKVDKEIRELTKQRDLAQSRVEDLLQMIGNDETSSKQTGHKQHSKWEATEKWEDECSASEFSEFDHHCQDRGLNKYMLTPGEDIEDHSLVEDEVTSANREVPEDQCKEVRCIETVEPRSASQLQSFSLRTHENGQVLDPSLTFRNGHASEENSTGRNRQNGFSYGTLEQRIQDVQRTINSLTHPYSKEPCSQDIAPNTSCSPRSGIEEYFDRTPPSESEKAFPGRPGGFSTNFAPFDYGSSSAKLSRNNSHSSAGTDFVDDMKSQGSKNMADEEIPTIGSFVAGLKDARFQYEKQIRDFRVWESGAQSDEAGNNPRSTLSPDLFHQFESLRGRIIELWHACSVSLVHRTYFFLLFKGDPTDSIYLEVELRRLSFLKESSCQGQLAAEERRQSLNSVSSLRRSLRREREALSKLIKRRYSEEERKKLYENWGIGLDSKRRRLQLVSKLWSDTKDLNHIKESACIVAKLVKFSEQGQALKEMFGLSFTPPRMIRRSFKWVSSVTNRS